MQRKLAPLARLLGPTYGVPGLKAALNLLGYDVGVPRPPLVPVPDADTQVTFAVSGPGVIAGVDNGLQTSLEPFQANRRRAFNGKCLAVVRSAGATGTITLTATAAGLTVGSTKIAAR